MRYLLTPCTVYTGTEVLPDHAVLVNGDRIEAVLPAGGAVPPDVPRRDGHGLNLCPGFVDLQIYGGGGVLFSVAPTPRYWPSCGRTRCATAPPAFCPACPPAHLR